MAKNTSKLQAAFRSPVWPVVAVASLVTNGVLVGYWYFVTHSRAELQLGGVVQALCTEPGYTRWMRDITKESPNPAASKKFAAASVCFTDYETGMPILLESVKPNLDASYSLPAKP